MLSTRDREILRSQVADKIDQLVPMTQQFENWRPVFEAEVLRFRIKGNGCPSNSDERQEYYGWSVAYQIVLDENA